MRDLTSGVEILQIAGTDMRQIITNLENSYPGFQKRLLEDDRQRIKPNIAVMIDGRNARRILNEKVDKIMKTDFIKEKESIDIVTKILNDNSVHYDKLGKVSNNQIEFSNEIKLTIEEIEESNKTWFKEYMDK